MGWGLERPLRRLDRPNELRLSAAPIRRMPKEARTVDRMRLAAGFLTASKVAIFGPNATDPRGQRAPQTFKSSFRTAFRHCVGGFGSGLRP